MGETVTIDRVVLQCVLDFACKADSACSGYADDEEVDALRSVAVALGLDPMEVTPSNFRCKYRGSHVWKDWGMAKGLRHCADCRKQEPPAQDGGADHE